MGKKITLKKIKIFSINKLNQWIINSKGIFYKVYYTLKNTHLPTFNEPFLSSKIPATLLISEDVGLPSIYHFEKKHDDLGKLLQLIQHYQPKTVIEFGTSFGNTVANICKHSTAMLYTVNALPEQISGSVITGVLSKESIGRVYKKYGFSNRVVQIYENTLSVDLEKYMAKESADFAIIDACHDIDYIINDFNKILPFLKKDAIVLFHDTHPSCRGHLLNSYQACMKLRKQNYDIKHIKNTWWAIWINQ